MSRVPPIRLAGLALVSVACCIALPLLVVAGTSTSIGAAGGLALALAVAVAARTLIARPNPEKARVGRDCCAQATTDRDAGRAAAEGRARPLVEILYFDGCPNHEGARALVERVSHEIGVEPELWLVNVPDEQSARRLRFLGSPTVRVGGEDVDPQAAERDDYVLSCRVYRTEGGFAGQPDERWIRDALEREASKGAGAASKLA